MEVVRVTVASIDDIQAQLAAEKAERARLQGLLRALYDTASDVAEIRDPEAVLAAIVQRTRAMTGADMAYLSLNDHTVGETFIRKSDGVRTEAYRTIRMPLGTGVLGKAATGRAMVTTTDYVDDPTLVHLEDIDQTVRGEGVRSILGVPMIVHGRVQGALLIADRRPVEYSPETVEIVDTIARQAAVAIDYAARLEQVTTALRDLGEQQDADVKRVHALEGLLDLDRRMSDIVVRREGIDPILGLVSSVYDAPVELILPSDLVQATSALSAALHSVAAGGLPAPVVLPEGHAIVAPVAVGGRHFAWLMVRGAIPQDRRDILERAALNLAMSLLIDEIEAASETRSQYELFDDLISGRAAVDGSTRARLSELGIDARRPLWLIAVGATELPEDHVTEVRRVVGGPTLLTVHAGHLCVLHQEREARAHALHSALRRESAQVASARVGAIAELNRSHRNIEIALATLRLLGGAVIDADSLGAVGALLEAEEQGHLPQRVTAPAGALVEYDDASGTDLVRTAWTWLEFGPHITRVAERLIIHPNTLRQRLARIAVLLGEGWDGGAGRLDLHLALRAAMIQRELRASER